MPSTFAVHEGRHPTCPIDLRRPRDQAPNVSDWPSPSTRAAPGRVRLTLGGRDIRPVAQEASAPGPGALSTRVIAGDHRIQGHPFRVLPLVHATRRARGTDEEIDHEDQNYSSRGCPKRTPRELNGMKDGETGHGAPSHAALHNGTNERTIIMNPNQQDTRLSRESADQKMADGTQKYLSKLASLPVGGGTYTPAEIIQIFKDRIATNQAVQTVTAQRAAAVKADDDKRAQTGPTVRAFRRMVQGMFSESPDTLAAFGLAPLKVATKDVATKTEAVAKALATRAARHTMGTRQKAKIKGTTTGASTGSPASPGLAPAAAGGSTPVTAPAPTAGPSPAAAGLAPVTAPPAAAGPAPAAAGLTPAAAATPTAGPAPAPAPGGAPAAPPNPAR